ncbi:MAG TPA: Yip1 family protein [Stellaceae bacterium]
MDIVTRAKNMILSPAREWPVVASEPASVAGLYQGYIIPLSAIPPLATLIGSMIFLPYVSFGVLILGAILTYVLGLIAVFILAWIAARLAAMFGGVNDFDAGLKFIAFGATASWVGGIFHLIPALWILSLLASIYGIYLFYTGVSPVMNVPTGRAVGYLISVLVAGILVFIIVFAIIRAIVGTGMHAMAM